MLWALCLAAELLAGVLAGLLARRDRSVRVVAELAPVFVLADVEIAVAGALVLDHAPVPFRGVARALFHVETALLLLQPFAAAAMAWHLFAWPREAARAVVATGVAWVLINVALVIAYPLPRGWHSHVLHAGMLGPAIGGLAAAYRGRRRPWGRAHVLVLLVLGMLLSIGAIGPFVRNDPYKDWDFARISGIIGFGAVAAFCAAWLGGWSWKAPSLPSEPSSPSR